MPTLVEGLILVGYCLVMPLAFAACLVWTIREFRQSSQLALAGVSTQGQIIGRRTSRITRGRSYFVSYRFLINATISNQQVVTSEQEVNPNHYNQLEVDRPVEITYLPYAPQVSRLAGSNLDNTGRLRAIFYSLLLGLTWLALFVTILRSVIH